MKRCLLKAATHTLTGHLPTLAQIADTAVFLASDAANAMTGTVLNMTSGIIVD
ncbi:hypothetical protein [Fictibacillus macauensis]|uniref:hypothetical protein n=1 Tax=Fictibacillus macauensis TaxID=245160 RepID=UPI0012E9B8B4|nr:hypothetical protein [Fictibacillus macauensis]